MEVQEAHAEALLKSARQQIYIALAATRKAIDLINTASNVMADIRDNQTIVRYNPVTKQLETIEPAPPEAS